MNIAILRGATINKWEMQNYEPLAKYFKVEGIYAKPNLFDTSAIKFPLKKFYSLAKPLNNITYGHYLGKMLFGNIDYPFFLTNYLKKFDIINTIETFYPYTIQALNSKKSNPKQKVIVTVWENIPFANEMFKKQIENKRRAIEEADHFIATTKRAKNALILEGVDHQRITTLYMGIDTNRFAPKEKNEEYLKKIGFTNDDFIILSIGRLTWEKGIQDIIKAVKPLIDQNEKIKLLIIGDGEKYDYLQNLASKLKISKNIKIIKHVSYSLLPEIHNLADVFVLPSIPTQNWQEQFGMVFIESMACQKPIISAFSGSIPEVIGDAGILVPPADVYSLTQELKKLHNNQSLRETLGLKARKKSQELFNSKKVGHKIKKIFERVYDC